MLETLSLLVHAHSKVGKSTLGGTAPPPVLIMDAEGSTKFLPLRMREWDPNRYGAPEYDGTWDAVVVTIRRIEDLQAVFNYLQMYPHPFRSIVVDSISEVQRKLKQGLTGGTGDMNQQRWGQILSQMDFLIRGFRDLTQHPTCPIQVAVFISETRMNGEGKLAPYMQGQIVTMLPYFMDIVGYLEVIPAYYADGQPQYDERGNQVRVRRLHVAAGSAAWESGERVWGRLGDFVDHPNIQTMLTTVYPHLAAAATTPEGVTS